MGPAMTGEEKEELALSLTRFLNDNGIPGRLVWLALRSAPVSAEQKRLAERMKLMWNENKSPHMAKALGVQGKRAGMAAARWKEHPSDEFWLGVILKLKSSKFCSGQNDRGWCASFDWLITPGNVEKVCEGKYDDARLSSLISSVTVAKPDGPIYEG